MKKFSGLLILLIMALLATPLFAVNGSNELFNEVSDYDFRTETKINVEEEVVVLMPIDYEILAVLSVIPYQQQSEIGRTYNIYVFLKDKKGAARCITGLG